MSERVNCYLYHGSHARLAYVIPGVRQPIVFVQHLDDTCIKQRLDTKNI